MAGKHMMYIIIVFRSNVSYILLHVSLVTAQLIVYKRFLLILINSSSDFQTLALVPKASSEPYEPPKMEFFVKNSKLGYFERT